MIVVWGTSVIHHCVCDGVLCRCFHACVWVYVLCLFCVVVSVIFVWRYFVFCFCCRGFLAGGNRRISTGQGLRPQPKQQQQRPRASSTGRRALTLPKTPNFRTTWVVLIAAGRSYRRYVVLNWEHHRFVQYSSTWGDLCGENGVFYRSTLFMFAHFITSGNQQVSKSDLCRRVGSFLIFAKFGFSIRPQPVTTSAKIYEKRMGENTATSVTPLVLLNRRWLQMG